MTPVDRESVDDDDISAERDKICGDAVLTSTSTLDMARFSHQMTVWSAVPSLVDGELLSVGFVKKTKYRRRTDEALRSELRQPWGM